MSDLMPWFMWILMSGISALWTAVFLNRVSV
jgi:hypothetical protein